MDEYETHEGEMKNEAELEEELDEKGQDIEEVRDEHFDAKEEEAEDTEECDKEECPTPK